MRVRSSLHKVCKDCKIVKRGRNVYVICSANSRHKQRQGFATLASSAAAVPVGSTAAMAALPVATAALSAVTMRSLALGNTGGIITSLGLPVWASRPAVSSAEDDEGL